MFNSFLNTLPHIFETRFPVNYRSTKGGKMLGSHKELNYHANKREVYIHVPSP